MARSEVRAIVVGLLFSLAGCGADDSSIPPPTSPGLTPACTTRGDCQGDQSCRRGVCEPDALPSRALSFSFIPQNNSGYLPQRTAPFEVVARERQDFALRPSLTLEGTIQSASGQTTPTGLMVFSPRGAGAIALTPRQARLEDDGQYRVALLQGSYDVTFFPEGRSAPMKIWQDQTFNLSTNFSRTLPVPLFISGTVSHQLPGALDARPLPVAGARVVARSQRTGELSTTALTSDEGSFTLQVRPESGPFDVIVSPDDAQDLLPRVVFMGRIDTREGQQPAPLALSLGQLSRVALPVTLRLDPEQREVIDFHPEDLRIIARAPFGAGELEVATRWRVIETPGRSIPDAPADWVVTLELPALAHTVEFLPPPSSRFARTRLALDLTSALGEQTVRLDAKAELALQVVDQMGAPLSRASVTLTPERQYTALTQEGVEQEALTLETDDEGILTAWVEPTRYQAEVIPHNTSSQPRAVFTLDGAMADATNPRELRLPAGQLIEGAVYDDALQPMPALRLQVHETVDAQLRLIGEASTDASGEFRVVIPAR